MTFSIVLWKTGLVEFRQLFGGIINFVHDGKCSLDVLL